MNLKNKEHYKKTLMFGSTLIIWGALTGLYSFIWYTFYSETIVQPFFRKGNWMVVFIYALLLYVFTRIYGGYKIGHLKRGDVMYSATLSMLFVNAITYCQVSLIGRMFMNPWPMLILCVADVLCIISWAVMAHELYLKIYPPRQMLLIYGSERAESLVYKMTTRSEKYDICEAVSIIDGLDAVLEKTLQYNSVIICDVPSEFRNKVLKHCYAHSVRTYITPKISDTIIRGADNIHLFDTPLLLCRNHGLTFEQRFFKRATDLALSGLALLLFSPFMAIIALCIKLYDGGPVLYRQTRLTLGGRAFNIYKFRSMVVDAEKETGARLAMERDGRITPVGRIIRRVRLDELPQLINIFKGDMSIVGPRPERPEIAAEYEKEMPEFSFRLKVKAGLTGYAQIYGKYNTTPYDKLKLDLIYIASYTLLMDIKVILMTIKILFVFESTEGIGAQATTAHNPVPPAPAPRQKTEKL